MFLLSPWLCEGTNDVDVLREGILDAGSTPAASTIFFQVEGPAVVWKRAVTEKIFYGKIQKTYFIPRGKLKLDFFDFSKKRTLLTVGS